MASDVYAVLWQSDVNAIFQQSYVHGVFTQVRLTRMFGGVSDLQRSGSQMRV